MDKGDIVNTKKCQIDEDSNRSSNMFTEAGILNEAWFQQEGIYEWTNLACVQPASYRYDHLYLHIY